MKLNYSKKTPAIAIENILKIILFSFFSLLFMYIFFEDYSYGVVLLIANSVILITYFVIVNHAQKKWLSLSSSEFIKRVFVTGLIFRVLMLFLLLWSFYSVTGTLHNPEARDSKTYDFLARIVAQNIIDGNGMHLDYIRGITLYGFDDIGYVFILGIIYAVTDQSMIIALFFQIIVDSCCLVLLYKIAQYLWDESICRIATILLLPFTVTILYSCIPIKEVYLNFFTLVTILSCLRLFYDGRFLDNIIVLAISLFAILSMRTVSFIALIFGISLFLLLNSKARLARKIIILTIASTLFLLLLIILGKYDDFISNLQFAFNMRGGRSIEYMANIQTFAKFASTPIFTLISVVMPFPTVVHYNNLSFGQSFQWYSSGGLIIWGALSYFTSIGIIYTLSRKKTLIDNALPLGYLIIYIIALIISIKVTSIRYNVPKFMPLFIYTAVGLKVKFQSKNILFTVYLVAVSIIIFSWNYIKLAGRGLI